MENFQDTKCPHPVLKISQYPLPRKLMEKIVTECDEILVLEEGAPVVEEMLKGYLGDFFLQAPSSLDAVATNQGKVSARMSCFPPIRGRLDGALPRVGELNPGIVRIALGMDDLTGQPIPDVVTPRPPALCKGCGHIDSYNALNEALQEYGKGHVFSDIGCYTLGFLPPYSAINTCVDMGASVTMAKGAADAGLFPAVAVIGDSTFIHSGITGLLDAVHNHANVMIVILDNSTTAMTGGQDYPAMGNLVEICAGVGVERDHIRVLTPLKKHHDEMVQVMKEELAYNGVSVVIPCRECIQTLSRKKKS
jgi:indolepyruvate ferredoxin oxidoreductase alpha subunit